MVYTDQKAASNMDLCYRVWPLVSEFDMPGSASLTSVLRRSNNTWDQVEFTPPNSIFVL